MTPYDSEAQLSGFLDSHDDLLRQCARGEITFWDFLLTPLLLPLTVTTRTVTAKR